VQPAAAARFQDRAGGGEQAHGSPRVALLHGDGRQDLEIVGGAGFVSGLGRQRQPLLQVSRRAGQVALSLPGQRQVVQQRKQGDPVLGPAGHGQAVGEQPRRGVAIALAEPDLAEDGLQEGGGRQPLIPVVPGEVVVAQLPQQGLALSEELAGGGVVAAECRQMTQDGQDARVPDTCSPGATQP
jgi:hypothetical protein